MKIFHLLQGEDIPFEDPTETGDLKDSKKGEGDKGKKGSTVSAVQLQKQIKVCPAENFKAKFQRGIRYLVSHSRFQY